MARIFKSTIIDAPLQEVWALLRDFNAHDRWHPAVAVSEIEDGKAPDTVGCVRRFRLRDGAGEIREQLLALSDNSHSFTYCILDAPLPLNDYVATVSLKPVTDGAHTLWSWASEFDPPADREAELTALVGEGIYQAGFNAVQGLLAAGAAPVRHREPERLAAPPFGARAPSRTSVPAAGGDIRTGAIVVRSVGGPEVLRWDHVVARPPGPGEVRIQQTVIGVNYIDVYCRTGYFNLMDLPGTPGMEAAGVVIDVGADVYGIMPGDRVAYACAPVGAYAEVRTMNAELLVVLPDDIDDKTAAAGLLKGMTAEFLLHRVHQVRAGDVVLVHAAAGGVGLLLCQWARALGATVIGTVGGEEKARLARRHGCTFPILYRERDFAEAVMEITSGRGADVVYDAVGRDSIAKSFEALALQGHLVSYGQASGDIGEMDVSGFATKSAKVSRPNYAHYAGTRDAVRAMSDRLFDAIRRGVVRIEIGQQYTLRDAASAHRDLEARRTTGSTVLYVNA